MGKVDSPEASSRASGQIQFLVADSGRLAGKQFVITPEGLHIGRNPFQCQIVIDDSEISRVHAFIRSETPNSALIEDSSVNGTYVNQVRVERQSVKVGDKIRFGLSPKHTFEYRIGGLSDSPDVPGDDPYGQAKGKNAASGRVPTIHLHGDDQSAIPQARLQRVIDQYAVENIPLPPHGIELGSRKFPGRIVVDHPSVSEKHAAIVVTPDGMALLRDLHSAQGTFVNGERLQERILIEGDLITLGESSTQLLYRDGKRHALRVQDVEMNRPLTRIGRDSRNELRLDHPTVSLFHAEIRRGANGFELVDRGSANGTYINGNRINHSVLKPRDRISIGAIQLTFDGTQIEQPDANGVWVKAYDICRKVRDESSGRDLVLLDRISLALQPREFIGFLGPSGSGKTTLMYALSGTRQADEGRVLINNYDLYSDGGSLRALMGYVPQDDILHLSLTVRECLTFAARLRLPDDHSEKEIRDAVRKVIRTVGLSDPQNPMEDRTDTNIAQLSGGQRKRVSLAVELLSNPSLLFMDEPTAGQDPLTEMKMMQLFRRVANQGASVVITTHLLGSFSLLDKVAVLVGGKLAYFGPSQEMLPYFKAGRPHEVYENLKKKSPQDWARKFADSELHREFVVEPLGVSKGSNRNAAAGSREKKQKTKHSSTRQLWTLLERSVTAKFKEWPLIAGLIGPPPLIAFLLGLMMQGATNDPKSLFIAVIVALWFGCSASVREIVDEQAIYRRERQRNLSLAAYLGSKLVYIICLAGVQSLLFVGVASLMNVLQNHFFASWVLMWVMTIQGALLGLLISALTKTPEKALYVFPLALIPQLLLAGLLLPIESIYVFRPISTSTNPKTACPVELQLKDQEKTPDVAGMPASLRNFVSPFVVARWGVEGFADIYVHDIYGQVADPKKTVVSATDILDGMRITAHPNDAEEVCNFMESQDMERHFADPNELYVPGAPKAAIRFYLLVLLGIGVAMIAFIAWAIKAKDWSKKNA